MCLVIDKVKDYRRACKGFTINGIKYKRLLGTAGGIKNSTIIFVNEKIHSELLRRVDNGRNPSVELVPAKLEAYRSLTCSASFAVSMPSGVIVVPDPETTFKEDVLHLNDDGEGEPTLTPEDNASIMVEPLDGCGMIMPSLAEKWSEELGLDYIASGFNTRFSFEKGMLFTFDFKEFADEVAGERYVTDVWGDKVDIHSVDVVLTASMVKLWRSYGSCEEYLRKSLENKYSFRITKFSPRELERERGLNYQFIQSYKLSKPDIKELIQPTIDEIKDVLGGDWRKTVLFLKGNSLTEKNVFRQEDDFVKAVMINPDMVNDPFVQSSVYRLIRNRINEAKVGIVRVHANFSTSSGDLYLLCQHMFGMELTGLLKAGEVYNKYWDDAGVDTVACFRAPMTCHNNIRLMKISRDKDVRYWFRYINTSTMFNSWDATMVALNGMDYDGDLVMLTDNRVLIDRFEKLPVLSCGQKNAKKKIVEEDDLILSNIDSFGNEIGQITNRVTSMFEVRDLFDDGSEEYEELTYRIQCGQQLQQNSIDKSKGIISKPMPKSWYNRHSANKIKDEGERSFYRSIVADRKPYFMIYIYPDLMREYTTYIRNTNRKALREFQLTVPELMEMRKEDLFQDQKDFLRYYEYRMPVGTSDCVMNIICKIFEDEFDGYVSKNSSQDSFDYSIMKSGESYSAAQATAISRIYEEYNKRLRDYSVFAKYERINEDESYADLMFMEEEFLRSCTLICSNERTLCDIILDITYSKNRTKRFAWSMCGSSIISNLLKNNDGVIRFPTLDEDGDIEYKGERFSVKTKKVGVEL